MANALSQGAGVTQRTSTALPFLEDQSPAILACIGHSPEFIKAVFSAVFRILCFFFPAGGGEGNSHKRTFCDETEDPHITAALNTESLKTPRPYSRCPLLGLTSGTASPHTPDTKKGCFRHSRTSPPTTRPEPELPITALRPPHQPIRRFSVAGEKTFSSPVQLLASARSGACRAVAQPPAR